jgi:hypothetical protein
MIQLTDKIVVNADEHQYIVGRATQRKAEGKEMRLAINNPKYYVKLTDALKSAIAQALRDKVAKGEITTLRTYVDELKQIHAEFTKLLEPLEIKI